MSHVVSDDRPFWKVAPIDRRGYEVIAASFVGLTIVYSLVGLMIVEWWEPSGAGRVDADISRWFERNRTDRLTEFAHIGSALSDTVTKVAMIVVLAGVLLMMYRRWHDWALLGVGLLLEVAVFGTASEVARRDRPPVEQLDGAPTNSWPSGHIAASVVFYVGIAVIVFWNTRRVWSRVLAVMIAVLCPSIVVWSRMYLGMHYATDAVAGVVLGFTCLAIVAWALRRTAGSSLSYVAIDAVDTADDVVQDAGGLRPTVSS